MNTSSDLTSLFQWDNGAFVAILILVFIQPVGLLFLSLISMILTIYHRIRRWWILYRCSHDR